MSDATSSGTQAGAPFRSLLAAWSLVVVVLAVAGFSARWSYYYNFGLQNLALEEPPTSLPVHAIEILRNPQNLGDLGELVVALLLPFEAVRLSALWIAGRVGRRPPNPEDRGRSRLGLRLLEGGLLIDALRAGLLVYIAFLVGGAAGIRDYGTNVVERTSRLPVVAAIQPEDHVGPGPIRVPIFCDTRRLIDRTEYVPPPFIGDAAVVRFLGAGGACSTSSRSWRLLYRDEKFVYLFATVPDALARPETLVLPHGDNLTLILR